MASFKEFLENIGGNIGFHLNRFRLDPEKKAQSDAIDQFGTAYTKSKQPFKQAIDNMRFAHVAGAEKVEEPWYKVGRNFSRVQQFASLNDVPVRNMAGMDSGILKQALKDAASKKVGPRIKGSEETY